MSSFFDLWTAIHLVSGTVIFLIFFYIVKMRVKEQKIRAEKLQKEMDKIEAEELSRKMTSFRVEMGLRKPKNFSKKA